MVRGHHQTTKVETHTPGRLTARFLLGQRELVEQALTIGVGDLWGGAVNRHADVVRTGGGNQQDAAPFEGVAKRMRDQDFQNARKQSQIHRGFEIVWGIEVESLQARPCPRSLVAHGGLEDRP